MWYFSFQHHSLGNALRNHWNCVEHLLYHLPTIGRHFIWNTVENCHWKWKKKSQTQSSDNQMFSVVYPISDEELSEYGLFFSRVCMFAVEVIVVVGVDVLHCFFMNTTLFNRCLSKWNVCNEDSTVCAHFQTDSTYIYKYQNKPLKCRWIESASKLYDFYGFGCIFYSDSFFSRSIVTYW